MGVNSLPKTVTRERSGYDLNPGPTAPESITLTTRLPSHASRGFKVVLPDLKTFDYCFLLARCYIVVCLSTRTSQVGMLSKWANGSNW